MSHDLAVAPAAQPRRAGGDLAVMLTGGGARAAYQVGLLRGISRLFPDIRFRIVTGVSAGAINAMFLAAHEGTLAEQVGDLADLWLELECDSVFRFDLFSLIPFRSALASVFPWHKWSRPHGLFDTTPLRRLLERVLHTRSGQPIEGVKRNLHSGALHAVALMTLDYTTGQSVRWVQGRAMDEFEGPNRRAAITEMTVEHVLASAALPFVFPAVQIGDRWHGDGGIRLAAPLSPAVQLGATRILAMSTGYQRTRSEEAIPEVFGYPPTAQILGQLMNAVFLDVIDEDVTRMERMNEMIRKLSAAERDGFRPIELLVLRPSHDLGKLAAEYEKYLPRNLKMLIRALGADETTSPDFVSMLMFEPNYTRELIRYGEADVAARADELRAFLGDDATRTLTAV